MPSFFSIVHAGRLLIRDGERRAVHRVSPRDVERALDGHTDDLVEILGEEAVDVGLSAVRRSPVGRREVLGNTALAGVSGIMTVWLPSSAVASSVGGAPTGEGFAETLTYTETDANAGSLAFLTPSSWIGDTFQVVAEGAAGGSHTNGLHAPGRGRRVGANLDRAALAGSTLRVSTSGVTSGETVTGGGGNGGQAIALVIGVSGGTALVVAGGGGGSGPDGAGGDADSNAETFTYASGSLTGGSAASGGTGGAGGSATGTWASVSTSYRGLDSPTDGIPTRGGYEQNSGGGAGGGGYGGGGTGGRANEASTLTVRATGGGGGGSYVNPTYRVGSATFGYSTRSQSQRCSLTFYYNE